MARGHTNDKEEDAGGGAARSGTSIPDINRYIDHTLLRPEATREQIRKLVREAREHDFYTVCVNGCWTAYCASELDGTSVGVATVVGFPLGAMATRIKAAEAEAALSDGATEIDMVVNVGALKDGDLDRVRDDIAAVTRMTGDERVTKVIIETVLLTDEEKVLACRIAEEAGAGFVKTSTGFLGGGATVADVELMRKAVGLHVKVKASGGIRDREQAAAMIHAGASRLGTSAGVAIVTGGSGAQAY